MDGDPIHQSHPAMPALPQAIADGRDPQIMRIVALVDTMMERGSADLLIQPLRHRLAKLRPPRPLRFDRLMFRPLDLLIVPTPRWRPGQHSIPRTALIPMAGHVRATMAAKAAAIDAEITGRTTAETELISRVGRSLWPEAAAILANCGTPSGWEGSDLGDRHFRPLADLVATLLAEAVHVDRIQADAATGMLSPKPQLISAVLSRVSRANTTALPMIIALLLDQSPQVAELLPLTYTRSESTSARAALSSATALLLRQLDQEDTTETTVAIGSLADAGAAVSRIAGLLKRLNETETRPRERDRLRALRHRLAADCKARFASGLEDELLAPLQHVGIRPADTDIPALEAAARGLRVLETAGRTISSGKTYDLLLEKAAEVIRGSDMQDRLAAADQRRLVEILVGPDAALAMLDEGEDRSDARSRDDTPANSRFGSGSLRWSG